MSEEARLVGRSFEGLACAVGLLGGHTKTSHFPF
jgi:hypothetical protein